MSGIDLLLQGRGVEQFASEGSAFVFNIDCLAFKVRFEGNYIYKAWAPAGSLSSQAVWRLSRTTKDPVTNAMDTEWADGNLEFDNVFDNRASLSYS